MTPFAALLKLNFKAMLLNTTSASRGRRGKARPAASGVGALVLLVFLMLFLSGTYSFLLGSVFAPMGALDLMLMSIVMMAIVFPFIFILYAAQAMVFTGKDADFLFSLPLSSFQVMLGRVLALYLEALLMCELMLLPAAASWLIHGGEGGVLFVLLLLVEGAFLAFIPTLLSLIIGGVVSVLVARLPFKNLFTVLFSLLLMAGIMALSFGLSFTSSSAAQGNFDVTGLRDQLLAAVPPLGWAVQGALGSPLALLGLAALCLLPFLLVTWLFSLFYKRLITSLSSQRVKSNYKLRGVSASGSFMALFKKEAKRFFGTPTYLLNSGVGLLMVIIGCVVALFNKSAITGFLMEVTGSGDAGFIQQYLSPMLLAVVMFFGSMTFVSCVSISLEGKYMWILKEAPLSVGRLFAAKAGFNFALDAVVVLLCIPMLAIAFSLPVADVAAMLLLGLLFSALCAMIGLFINLLLPRMDAENDTMIIKQSASVIVTMMAGWLLIALFVALFLLTNSLGWGFMGYAALAGAVLALLCVVQALLLNTTGRKLFAKL